MAILNIFYLRSHHFIISCRNNFYNLTFVPFSFFFGFFRKGIFISNQTVYDIVNELELLFCLFSLLYSVASLVWRPRALIHKPDLLSIFPLKMGVWGLKILIDEFSYDVNKFLSTHLEIGICERWVSGIAMLYTDRTPSAFSMVFHLGQIPQGLFPIIFDGSHNNIIALWQAVGRLAVGEAFISQDNMRKWVCIHRRLNSQDRNIG